MFSSLQSKFERYFSGRLAIIQLTAGLGSFAIRSLAAWLTDDHATWIIVVSSQAGSFAGYISAWSMGYWIAFRKDYAVSSRSMPGDIIRLQCVEQFPNIATVVPAALAQAALLETTDVEPVISVNLASWFGPHKIINLVAMLTSNSLKKAWVDHTWTLFRKLRRRWHGLFTRRTE